MLEGNSPGIRGRPPHQTSHGLTGTIGDAASANDLAILHHFHPPRVGAPARGTSTDIVTEAHDFLTAAEVEPPYFLIGWSAGGEIAFLSAQTYPEEVAGFVSLNPVMPHTRCSARHALDEDGPGAVQKTIDDVWNEAVG